MRSVSPRRAGVIPVMIKLSSVTIRSYVDVPVAVT